VLLSSRLEKIKMVHGVVTRKLLKYIVVIECPESLCVQ
jgi:hypothetical protein